MDIPVSMHNMISNLAASLSHSRHRETFLCFEAEVKSVGNASDGREVARILGSLEIKGMSHSVFDIFKAIVTSPVATHIPFAN